MRKVAEVWPLASFLQEELAARGWSWEALAEAMGSRLSTVRRIMTGERLTRHRAERLARAFGNSPRFWLRLDGEFWLSVKRELDEATKPQERAVPMEAEK
jgi:plasmid maintenance system antidote protein VapI